MIVIEGKMPGLNDFIRAMNANRHKGAAMKREWTRRVCNMAKAVREPKHSGRAWVHIRCYEPDMRRDEDNVRAVAEKFVLDGLVAAHVIVDDNRRWLAGCTCQVLTDRTRPRIEIQVTDAEGRR